MKSNWGGWLVRFLRVAVAVIIAGVVAQYGNHPYFLALAPFISAFSKWLRDKYGFDLKVV